MEDDEREVLNRLAAFGPAFAGNISRIGCFAEARGYADGQPIWSVDYDYDNRDPEEALLVEGALPRDLAAIVDQARKDEAEGRGSDIGTDVFFEVPGKMSKALSGFSPHEPPPEGFRWSLLQRIGGEPEPEPKPKGWFARLFG